MIGPLVPARVTAGKSAPRQRNLCSACWASRPQLALVNEQAYAAGLVGLYRDAGYRRHHDGLGQSRRRIIPNGRPKPNICRSARWAPTGASIALIWSNTIAVPATAALRPWRHRAGRLSGFCARPRGDAAARALPLCQRRGDFRFPSRPLPDRGKAVRRQRMGAAGTCASLGGGRGATWFAPSGRAGAVEPAAGAGSTCRWKAPTVRCR